jgi:hypothetical protein
MTWFASFGIQALFCDFFAKSITLALKGLGAEGAKMDLVIGATSMRGLAVLGLGRRGGPLSLLRPARGMCLLPRLDLRLWILPHL